MMRNVPENGGNKMVPKVSVNASMFIYNYMHVFFILKVTQVYEVVLGSA